MITENYVSFETAKLLKEKGFGEWCSKCYGVAVLHNGVDIDLDEEYELRAEGKENEIEYVEGGMLHDHSCNNHDKDAKIWAAPTIWATMKWLREVHNIHINLDIHWLCFANSKGWIYVIEIILENGVEFVDCKGDESDKTFYLTYEQAVEAAIKYCLENLI